MNATAAVAPFSILLLGSAERPEFRDAAQLLTLSGTVADFSYTASATAALDDGHIMPDLIIVAQAFPGEFSHDAVDRLRRLAPLARLVGLLGSWCEGEMRTGSPWPGVARNYWHQWPTRCPRELELLMRGARCAWALPPTATEEERLLADRETDAPRMQGLVVIHSPSRPMADWLSDACQSRGFATVCERESREPRVAGAKAAIFDAGDLAPDTLIALERFSAAMRPSPVVALLAFPRIEDRRSVLAAGAAAVLSKPVGLDDLFSAIRAARTWQ
jgi:hypothetical protein